jgi:hypothetical protein
MSQTLFMFTRKIETTDGSRAETAQVFANDLDAARRILEKELAALRADSSQDEPAFRSEPAWVTSAVQLDNPKLVSLSLT